MVTSAYATSRRLRPSSLTSYKCGPGLESDSTPEVGAAGVDGVDGETVKLNAASVVDAGRVARS
jgi:hypothetical protein